MALTRKFKDTVQNRAAKDPEFRRALFAEAFEMSFSDAASILALATKVFEGNEDAAREWLCDKQAKLGDRRPLDMLCSDSGREEVEKLLWRMEHGVFA